MHKKSRQLVMNQRSFFLKIGRGDRTRTCDSLVPNQERYQLRYTSLFVLRVQRYKEYLSYPNNLRNIFRISIKKPQKKLPRPMMNIKTLDDV